MSYGLVRVFSGLEQACGRSDAEVPSIIFRLSSVAGRFEEGKAKWVRAHDAEGVEERSLYCEEEGRVQGNGVERG